MKTQTSLAIFAALTLAAGMGYAQSTNPRMPVTTKPAQANLAAQNQGAISALLSAKGSLEKAGDKWGGHRVKAIAMIDHALDALGSQQHESNSEFASGSTDEPTLLNNGIASLQSAKSSLRGGGHAAQAASFINQALNELQIGIQYAKEHHTY